jgi:hypothetical protein
MQDLIHHQVSKDEGEMRMENKFNVGKEIFVLVIVYI